MEIMVVGDTAYEVGTYQMDLTPQGSPALSDVGKYLMVWKRASDGTWRVLRDMYNTNVPPSTLK
jgi:ketosteroid isomerase-like protein